MSLVASAFLPPSPLLIPEIGKQNNRILKKTADAYQQIAGILKSQEAEIIIIISPNGPQEAEVLSANLGPTLDLSFQEFGFLATIRSFQPALGLADEIKLRFGRERTLRFLSQPKLDYGSAVPLQLLCAELKSPLILPIFTAEKMNLADHYLLGKEIGEIIRQRPEKIAVIAAGDLSHRLKKNSPAGYSPKGTRFDNRVIEYLKEESAGRDKLLAMDEKIGTEALEGGLRQLALLFGIMGEGYETQVLCYQNDFGVGYLSVNFNLQVAPI